MRFLSTKREREREVQGRPGWFISGMKWVIGCDFVDDIVELNGDRSSYGPVIRLQAVDINRKFSLLVYFILVPR